MKLSLSIALILAVIIGLGGCTPSKKPKREHGSSSSEKLKSAMKQVTGAFKKKVTFKTDLLEICPASENEMGFFWMPKTQMRESIEEKYNMFDNKKETEFIGRMDDVISANYEMFNFLHCFATEFRRYDKFVRPIDMTVSEVPLVFPDPAEFDVVKTSLEKFDGCIIGLLHKISPAYEMNKDLFAMMDTMQVDTKIDSTLMNPMYGPLGGVMDFLDEFQELFEKFSMNAYLQEITIIQKIIRQVEFTEIGLDSGIKKFNGSMEKIKLMIPDMETQLNIASKMDFEALEKNTKAFYKYVKEALDASKASTS